MSSPEESVRLEALRRLDILDSETEQAFDDLTALAASICGTPISVISLVDADRLWFKSRVGLELEETPRSRSFCGHAILEDRILVVGDAAADRRFAASPLVVGAPAVRFYAGKPLLTSEGHAVGTLCVMDCAPRDLAQAQLDALDALGRQTVALLEHRRAQALLRQEIALVELLRESATAANEAAGLHEALALCIERVCERIGWPVGRAYALARDGEAVRRVSTGVWRVPAEAAFQDFREAAGELFSAREGPLARMLASRQSLWIPNIGAEPTLARPAALAAGLYAAVFVPVLVRDEVVAVLEFYCAERDEPDERLLEVMGNLGTQLGRVVERERAERALGRRLADLRAVLDATAEAICLSDQDGAVRFVNTAMEELCAVSGSPTRARSGHGCSSSPSARPTPPRSPRASRRSRQPLPSRRAASSSSRTAAPSSPTASRSRTRTSSPGGSSSSARRPPTGRWTGSRRSSSPRSRTSSARR